jgi:hypothetical protein
MPEQLDGGELRRPCFVNAPLQEQTLMVRDSLARPCERDRARAKAREPATSADERVRVASAVRFGSPCANDPARAAARSDRARRRGDKLNHEWALTFDMSGKRKQAQPAVACPLDGEVRCLDE